MSRPPLSGLHHLKVPVSDLDASLEWYGRVFGAVHRPEFTHTDRDGNVYAAIVELPGVDTMLELRLAPRYAHDLRGFDPIILASPTHADLVSWQEHLDGLAIENSGIIYGIIGWTLIWHDPDGRSVRVYSDEQHPRDMEGADIGNLWLQYPSAEG